MKLSIAILLLLCYCGAYTQHTIGIPDIINFSRQQYHSGTQNWDIKQDGNGIMYFANNDGLLTYDGSLWRTYKLPDRTHLRSVEIGEGNKIYTGGQDNIGYFAPDALGTLQYHSLNGLVPQEERSIGEVWDIITYGKDIFFRSRRKILRLHEGKITVYKSTKEWRYMDMAGGRLVAQDAGTGLCVFQQEQWKLIDEKQTLPADFTITSLLRLSADSTLITTLKHGIYILAGNHLQKLNNPALEPIAQYRLYAACHVNNKYILIGTRLNGCYIMTRQGELVQHFSKAEGLQNNDVLCTYLDRDNNLWLGLDNGIDFMAYNNAIKHIYPDTRSESAGYSSVIYNHRLYLATSSGLYSAPLDTGRDISFNKGVFTPVENTDGQVWNVSVVNNLLLMGHHEGAFIIENNRARSIASNGGYWSFATLSNGTQTPWIIGGGYYGLNIFDVTRNFDTAASRINFESSRFVIVDEDDKAVWIAHPYKGLFKITYRSHFADSVSFYTTRNAPLGLNNNYLFRIRGKVVLTSEKGIFEYNAAKDQFIPYTYLNDLFKKIPISYLKEDAAGNIWFVSGWSIGVIDVSGNTPRLIYIPELHNQLVTGFEHINPIDPGNVLIGGEKGFYHLNYAAYKNNIGRPIPIYIAGVKTSGKSDSLIFGGYGTHANTMEVDYASNSFHFEFAAPLYASQKNIEYSYYLKGFDGHWSGWGQKSEKDYTNLREGTYTFEVKARTNLNTESVISSYTFIVLPPWYRTWWAYGLYALFFIAATLAVHTYQHNRYLQKQKQQLATQQKKHQEEQQHLQYIQEIESNKKEKEIIELKNEKLNADLEYKNAELASKAMNLVQKSEMLSSIKEELLRLQGEAVINKDSKDFKKLVRTIDKELDIQEDWEQFSVHFDTVHTNFLRTVKERFPDLTANELKLCAYLRLNLSSKEIAQLMNISLRGVETSRYRLRKKLDLQNEGNLYDFLLTIG